MSYIITTNLTNHNWHVAGFGPLHLPDPADSLCLALQNVHVHTFSLPSQSCDSMCSANLATIIYMCMSLTGKSELTIDGISRQAKHKKVKVAASQSATIYNSA